MNENCKSTERQLNRRKLLQSAAIGTARLATAAIAAPYVVPARVFGAESPSNRITVGIIGTGNRGFEILKTLLNDKTAQVVAVCDVNRASFGYRDDKQFLGREPARQLVNDHYAKDVPSGKFNGCDIYTDFREVLARKDIDAVAIVVPDHWHGVMTVMACKAGKDIYCEKPMSLTIAQGRAMVEAVRRHKRVLQTGSHERSNPRTIHAIELVRSGRIGKVKKITTFVGFNNKVGPGPGWQPMPVPDGFDYETWLGPAPRGAVSQGSLPVSVSLQLRLFGRSGDEFRRPFQRHGAMGARRRRLGPDRSGTDRSEIPARRQPVQHGAGNEIPRALCQRRRSDLPDR